jgi:predicted dehydrogenase
VKQVNWGIIGLGNIAEKFAEAFKFSENAKLVAIASLNQKKINKFKYKFQIEDKHCFSKYEKLLSCNDVDIVYIALPHSLHYEWIVKCIEKRKRILVEKPATINFSQIKDIQNKLSNKNLLFSEGFMYRYHPQIIKLIELIKENIIGKIISMESFFGMDILTKKNLFGFKKQKKMNKENRLYNKELGGGTILDLGCYPVSFSQFIASLIPGINLNNVDLLNVKKEIGETGVDIDSYVELEFDKKFRSKIGASFTKNLGKESKIIGEKGEILIVDTWYGGDGLIKIKGQKDYKIEIKSCENIFAHEIENLSYSVLEDKKESNYPGMTLEETLLNMKILEKWIND